MAEPTQSPNRVFMLLCAVLILPCAAWLSAGVRADNRAACIDRAAASDLAGKIAFQNGLYDLIADGKPDFAALAALNRDLQLALAASRAEKLAYLLWKDPERMETGGTLAAFRNFDWTGADEAALRRASETYLDLARRIADLRRRSDGHPDWPQMRAFFAESLTNGDAYRELMARLAENDGDVAAILESCPPG